ncbi:NUDIX domain-containing protein [Actinomycetota bacterium Odt1-20B]
MAIPRAVTVVLDGPRVLLMKRFRRHRTAAQCTVCAAVGWSMTECPGHDYAVLPGGHVEPDETLAEAAVRELREETTLIARVERVLWTGLHNDRPATYFLMADVEGRARLSGPEAEANAPDNRFELCWATVDDLNPLGLHPAEARQHLAGLLRADRQPPPAGSGPSGGAAPK